MRKFIFTLIIILAGYIAYMYFFGKGDDKTNAKIIVVETKDLANTVGKFLSHQKIKYDNGEFDQLIQKMNDGIEYIKQQPHIDEAPYSDRLRDMLIELRKLDPEKLSPENQKKLEKTKKELETLLGIPPGG